MSSILNVQYSKGTATKPGNYHALHRWALFKGKIIRSIFLMIVLVIFSTYEYTLPIKS